MIAASATLFLAGTLAVAGAAKLLDLRASAAAVRGFGTPERFVPALSLGLPLGELAIALALLPAVTSRAAAAAAAALFCCFSAVVAITLLRGRRPDCGCFGRLHSAPIGAGTLARVAGLAGIAALLAWNGTGAGIALVGEPVAWLAAVAGGQSILLVAVLRRHGRLLAGAEGSEAPAGAALEIGDAAPNFALPDLAGDRVALGRLAAAGRPILLIFGHSGCAACTALLPAVASWQREHAERVTIAVVTQGDVELNRVHALEQNLDLMLLDKDQDVADSYGVEATPAGILVGAEGRVAGPVAYGADGVRALLEHVLPPARAPRHAPAPVAPRLAAGGAAGAAAAALVPPDAVAATLDDEAAAFAELRQILVARNRTLSRHSNNVVRLTRRLIAKPRSQSLRFELKAAIAVGKTELRHAIDELEAVAVPDYRPGEKGARLAKSNAISFASLTGRMLDSYAAALTAKTLREVRRLDADIARFSAEAEKNRRLLSKRFGCTKRLEEC
jgi:methylamine dehydrogenase accessory protein MauD